MSEYTRAVGDYTASNRSIFSTVKSNTERPSMQQDTHPEHNMPKPEHDGVELGTEAARTRSQESDQAEHYMSGYR